MARVAGDQFAVLVDNVARYGVLSQLARKIRIEVAGDPFIVGGESVDVDLRTTFRYGPDDKPLATNLLWEAQWWARVDANRSLHQRLKALEEGQGARVGVAENLRARLFAAEQRARLADVDDLTGLCNRRGLKHALDQIAGKRVVAFIDMDNLRDFNGLDGENWVAGDKALAGLARLLESFAQGSVAARWGGDEFVLVVPGDKALAVVAELTALNETARRRLRFGEIAVSFSAGVAAASGPLQHDLAQQAAQAKAKEAKASGRGQVLLAQL